jgi:lantibiotic transport system permease protein
MIPVIRTDFKKMSKLNFIIVIGIPIVVVLMGWGIFQGGAMNEIGRSWKTLLMQLTTITTFLVPMGITIIGCSLANTEHKARAWKLMFALPVTRRSIYLSKFFYLIGFMLLVSLLLCAGIILIGVTLNLPGSIPLFLILKQIFYPFLASIPIMAFQLWLSLSIRNQAFPMIIGIFTAIFSYTFTVFSSAIGNILFWAYPSLASPLKPLIENGSFNGVGYSSSAWLYALLGAGIGLIFIYIGMKHFIRKDVY